MKLRDYIRENADREIVDIEALEKCLKPKKQKTIHDIENGERYFVLMSTGEINSDEWGDYVSEKECRSIGFAFLTEEEAEKRKKMFLIEEELIQLGGRREFKVGKDNYYLNFKFADGYIIHRNSTECTGNEIDFDTQEQIADAVKQIGTQRIIDEYFKPRLIYEED